MNIIPINRFWAFDYGTGAIYGPMDQTAAYEAQACARYVLEDETLATEAAARAAFHADPDVRAIFADPDARHRATWDLITIELAGGRRAVVFARSQYRYGHLSMVSADSVVIDGFDTKLSLKPYDKDRVEQAMWDWGKSLLPDEALRFDGPDMMPIEEA